MEKNRKNLASILGWFAIFFSLASPGSAALGNSLAQGFLNINNFFESQRYLAYIKVIDFMFFFFLFFSIYYLVVPYAFGKDQKSRPVTFIAFLLGLMTSLLFVAGGYSVSKLIAYLPWLIFVFLFLFFWKLLEYLGVANKFLRFLLALLLALLTMFLLSWLIFPDNQFSSFFDGFGRIDIPSISAPGSGFSPPNFGGGVRGPSATPPSESGPTPSQEQEEGWWSAISNYASSVPWWGWLLFLTPFLLALIMRAMKRRSQGQTSASASQSASLSAADAVTIQTIIDEIRKISNKKKEILKKIDEIVKKKEASVAHLHDRYHKALKYDEPFWLDPSHEAHKEFISQPGIVYDILKREEELEMQLNQLLEIERSLIGERIKSPKGKFYGPKEWTTLIIEMYGKNSEQLAEFLEKTKKETPLLFWDRLKDSLQRANPFRRPNVPEWYPQVLERIVQLSIALFKERIPSALQSTPKERGICAQVLSDGTEYFIIGKEGVRKKKIWAALMKEKNLEKWVKNRDRWKNIKNVDADSIKEHFENKEKVFFERRLAPSLRKQIAYMDEFAGYLEILQKKNITLMQELRVSFRKEDGTIADLSKEEAANPANAIPYGTPFKVYTLLATGDGPFELYCQINGKPIDKKKRILKKEYHPEISLDILDSVAPFPGKHRITYTLISQMSPDPLLRELNRDEKSIVVHIVQGTAQGAPISPETRIEALRRARSIITDAQIQVDEAIGGAQDSSLSEAKKQLSYGAKVTDTAIAIDPSRWAAQDPKDFWVVKGFQKIVEVLEWVKGKVTEKKREQLKKEQEAMVEVIRVLDPSSAQIQSTTALPKWEEIYAHISRNEQDQTLPTMRMEGEASAYFVDPIKAEVKDVTFKTIGFEIEEVKKALDSEGGSVEPSVLESARDALRRVEEGLEKVKRSETDKKDPFSDPIAIFNVQSALFELIGILSKFNSSQISYLRTQLDQRAKILGQRRELLRRDSARLKAPTKNDQRMKGKINEMRMKRYSPNKGRPHRSG